MATATLVSQTDLAEHTEVIFTVLDDAGVRHGPMVELRSIGEDIAAFLAAYAPGFAAALTAGEIGENIAEVTTLGSLATPTLRYSTAAANFAALRLTYQSATQVQVVMIGDFLNTLTNVQLEAAFGLTLTQVQNLRTNKLAPAATLATSIRASAGQ